MPQVGPLKLSARVMCGESFAMGPGKAELLETIARVGSISAAGREVGMSYRRAWVLVDEMNRCWAEPLVLTRAGSASKGAQLSDLGREVLAAYRALEADLVRAADSPALQAMAGKLLATPRPGPGD